MTGVARKLKIRGRVQGVSFRYYAQRRAQGLRLKGWIRNAEDSSVEALVQGEEDSVKQFIDWAHAGPSMADVSEVEVNKSEMDESLRGFEVVGS